MFSDQYDGQIQAAREEAARWEKTARTRAEAMDRMQSIIETLAAERDAFKAEAERLRSVARDSLDGLEGCEADARSIAVRIREALLTGVTPVTMHAVEKKLEIPESEIDAVLRGE